MSLQKKMKAAKSFELILLCTCMPTKLPAITFKFTLTNSTSVYVDSIRSANLQNHKSESTYEKNENIDSQGNFSNLKSFWILSYALSLLQLKFILLYYKLKKEMTTE